jgi:hypothetical protein
LHAAHGEPVPHTAAAAAAEEDDATVITEPDGAGTDDAIRTSARLPGLAPGERRTTSFLLLDSLLAAFFWKLLEIRRGSEEKRKCRWPAPHNFVAKNEEHYCLKYIGKCTEMLILRYPSI